MISPFIIGTDGKVYDGEITASKGLRISRKTGFMKREDAITADNPIVGVEIVKSEHKKGSNAARGAGMALGSIGGLAGMALGAAVADKVSKGTDELQISVITRDTRRFVFTVVAKEYEQILAHAQLPAIASQASVQAPTGSPNAGSDQERLHKLKALFEQGLISQAEYAAKRKEIVDNL
jgi:hypothetical protein